ncbi:MAG: tetratricopeptide repeat protein, partial [Pseudomonadota bacterium]
GNTFVIQDEIASSVANALQATILGTTSIATNVDSGGVEARNLALIATASLARRTLVDIRAARDLYAQASTLAPNNPNYYAGYAQAVALQYWNFRDITPAEAIAEASAAVDRALELAAPSADTLAIAGLVEELRASTAEDPDAKARALSYYHRAIEQDPKNILALQWLASIYLDINKPAEARDAFEKVVELDPLNTLALTGLANAYFNLGLRERGRQHLYKVQSLFPHLGMSYRYLSFDSWATGRLDRSAFWINRSAELDPNPLEIFLLIQNYVSLGWADKALDAAEQFRQSSSGVDISRLVQAQLDHDFETLSVEAKQLHESNGEQGYATLSAWADAAADNCQQSVTTLERLYPSLKGETIEYIDSPDLIDAVLLAHCNKKIGRNDESMRLAIALLDSDLLNDSALEYRPALRMVRVGLYAVMGEVQKAISELSAIDVSQAALALSSLALPVDELPIFDNIKDHETFQAYASQERYRIAQQARMLASGETEKDIRLDVQASGFELADWR